VDLIWDCVQSRRFEEIVARIDLGLSLGGFSVSSRFTLHLFNVSIMFVYLAFLSGVISGVLTVWFNMCLSCFSGWSGFDSGLGQWFIAGWFRVGAKFYLKSVPVLIRNLSGIHLLFFGFGFGFVLVWVSPLFGIPLG